MIKRELIPRSGPARRTGPAGRTCRRVLRWFIDPADGRPEWILWLFAIDSRSRLRVNFFPVPSGPRWLTFPFGGLSYFTRIKFFRTCTEPTDKRLGFERDTALGAIKKWVSCRKEFSSAKRGWVFFFVLLETKLFDCEEDRGTKFVIIKTITAYRVYIVQSTIRCGNYSRLGNFQSWRKDIFTATTS